MRTNRFLSRHCRSPLVGPQARAGTPPWEGAVSPAAVVPALNPYRRLQHLLRQTWDGWWAKAPAAGECAVALAPVVHPSAAPTAHPAVNPVQDGVVDQAMAKVHTHLGCMLDLAVDATQIDLPVAQRTRIQTAINQHVACIDHIARTTAVAGQHLLDGSCSADSGQAGPATPQGWVGPALPNLRAQALSLDSVSVSTPALAWAGQLRLEQTVEQLAQTRAGVATAQLLARLARVPARPARRGGRAGALQGMVKVWEGVWAGMGAALGRWAHSARQWLPAGWARGRG